jgi:uncharacterized protein (DUF2126 family)
MSLTQQLLVRALIARFWDKPYHESLVRWGTSLHDRFMLPHFVEQDFNEVLQELSDDGYRFQKEWFSPHVEFRFPLIGETAISGIHIELRQAIEPWHVLGEEFGGTGAARYVDSSVERVQVKVNGLAPDRYAVAVKADGAVTGIEILEYRESYGHQIRGKQWREQFIGKTMASPLQLDVDIKNLSGATLSSAHVTEGVRRLVHTYALVKARI